ncbi:unnamed protein product [Cylicocyclus nassatus]|uniref:Uncharacterized protein n=1 Tax=Cylicocyclus nassatus TaxID=53992 RepID=A0AA36GHN5_CYLNA|nr:unnamed protein product [Cylicocyclus nassatus]
MTSTVRAYKGLTTKRIDNVLNWLRESSKLLDPVAPDLRQGQAQKIKLAIELCDENISLMESSLTKLTEAFDRIEDTDNEEEEQLDKYLESAQETIIKLQVHKTNLKQVMHEIGQESSGYDEEKETWDRYWSLESSGTEEYTGSQKTEVKKLNEKVLKDFKDSIEKRADGYYVRLPWKEQHPQLPDNKALALKRLKKVLKGPTGKRSHRRSSTR